MNLYKSKTKSETTGEPYIVRIVIENVEWVDNPNAPKSSTAPLLMTIVQRQKLSFTKEDCPHLSDMWKTSKYEDDKRYKPFGIWKDDFSEFFEEL